MNPPTLWWRLSSLWGATLAGLGLTRSRSAMRIVRVPPEPLLRRFWHVFLPPPPRQDFQLLTQPSWFGPPESEIGVAASGRKRTTFDAEGLAVYPFERFSERAKNVLTLAQEEAERSHHNYIGTEHLLLGLMRESGGIGAQALTNLGLEIGEVRQTIESVLGRNERIVIQQIIPTSRVKKVIEISFEEARRMGHNSVGTEHLLLGLLIEGDGIAAHVLADLGATLEKVRPEIERLLSAGTEELAPGQGLLAYKVGDRVLVHDPDPPYRLWEGRVAKAGELHYEVSIPGRSKGEHVAADLQLIHPVPMKWTHDCPFCSAG
ncbi:MAG TPA: Clp protease N-terminal domain-containing protein [Candidatus Dormibacteraeota bacterium]|nr:Clp protease N-terminal domain-containing protein [Candidatus Dormibacteraeota bacterium]